MNVHDRPGSSPTATRLGAALLGYLLAVTVLLTLLPFEFEWPAAVRIMWLGPWRDGIANVVLFLPLGFLARLVRRDAPRGLVEVLLGGALTSIAIESLQLFLPARHPSPLDVLTNAVGAWLGALLHDAVTRRRRLDARLVSQLGLELPLMGLVYLLVPLLWLAGLARGEGWFAFLPTAGFAIFGATLLATIQRLHFGPRGIVDARGMVIGAITWFAAGTIPTLRTGALVPLAVIGAMVALVAWRGGMAPEAIGTQRRFEVSALRRSAPLLAFALLALAAQPLVEGVGPWRASWGLAVARGAGAAPLATRTIIGVVEAFAAFTVFGYLLAELRSRHEASFAAAWRRLLAWSVPCAAAAVAVRGFAPGGSASASAALALGAAALYGGWLYHLLRTHVQWILAVDAARA